MKSILRKARKPPKTVFFNYESQIEHVITQNYLNELPDRVETNIFLGNLLHARRRKNLKKCGITFVIQISQKRMKNPFPQDFNYFSVVINQDTQDDEVLEAHMKINKQIL